MNHSRVVRNLLTVAALGISTIALGQVPGATSQVTPSEPARTTTQTRQASADTSRAPAEGTAGWKWNPLQAQREISEHNAHRAKGEEESWDPTWQNDPRIGRYQRSSAPN